MIYFIVTTSIFNHNEVRRIQYVNAIYKLRVLINKYKITEYRIIIVENNGVRKTYLDDLNSDVFYTYNNTLKTNNKGIKELKDVFDCIKYYNIKDDDFIVKMTGRYILENDSEFFEYLKKINNSNNHNNIDCIIKYGPYYKPVDYKMQDCITGLVGMKCKYVKQIQFPNENECVEWKWAKATYLIPDTSIIKVDKLGIKICPNSDNYFLV